MADSTITIAGRMWWVPLLAPRQNRIVLPGLLAIGGNALGHYDTLCDVIFAALTRANPHLLRSEFEDWPISVYELVDALPIVAEQTGFMGKCADPARPPRYDLPDWDAIIAQFVNFLPGTTPDYWEDALTAPRLTAMREEWRNHPPLVVLAAGWLGYWPKPRDKEALEELMRLFPTGKLTATATLH